MVDICVMILNKIFKLVIKLSIILLVNSCGTIKEYVGLSDEDVERELTDFEKRLAKDYQLQRAIDLIRGVSLYKESIE